MRIAGDKVGAGRKPSIEIRYPYNGHVIGSVPKATSTRCGARFDIALAYRPKLSRLERAQILHKAARAVRARSDEIAAQITAESGLGLNDSRVRGRPRRRRARVRRERGAEGRRPDLFVRHHAARPQAARLHAARAAARGDHRDHAVQPPDEPGGAQGGAERRDEQPHGAEAVGEGAAVGADVRRHPVRSRAAAADAERRHRRPARDRRRADHQPGGRPRSPSPAALRSASRSPPRRATGASCSSSAATIRSS